LTVLHPVVSICICQTSALSGPSRARLASMPALSQLRHQACKLVFTQYCLPMLTFLATADSMRVRLTTLLQSMSPLPTTSWELRLARSIPLPRPQATHSSVLQLCSLRCPNLLLHPQCLLRVRLQLPDLLSLVRLCTVVERIG
jgi:hypothetical protein